jgi:hypothetical protein
MMRMEKRFESPLWNSRFIVMSAVVASLAAKLPEKSHSVDQL